MNQVAQIAYEEAAQKAKVTLEGEGYKVVVPRQSKEMPQFMSAIEPDIIGTKGGGGVVVGIKTIPSTPEDEARLKKIANEVPKHEGWRFSLYLARPRQELLDRPLQPNVAEIEAEIGTVRKILRNEGPKVALVYAWALLEALARHLILDEMRGEAKRYKPASVAGLLVSEGFLQDEEGGKLRHLADLRNLVVHGFTRAEIRESDLEWFIGVLDKLLRETKQS